MPASVVIELRAQNSGSLLNSNGLILHAAWFKGWTQLNQSQAIALHQDNQPHKPFTISPLMNLAADDNGVCNFRAGQTAWFRIATLTDDLSDQLIEKIFARQNPQMIQMAQSQWQVEKISTRSDEHLWAGKISYDALIVISHSRNSTGLWTLEFASPTAINGDRFVYPFPSPESLARSWLRKWQAYAPCKFPDQLLDEVREHLSIKEYNLHTETVRMRGQKWPGCVGRITFEDRGLAPDVRQALDVLMQFSFFCGSGYKTTQGMGQTRLIKKG